MNLRLSLENTALIVVMLANIVTPFMSSAINLAIPAIGTELGGSTLMLSWLVASYSLAAAGFMLPCGRLADIIGRKKVFEAGMFLFSLFTFLSGAAWSMTSMILFRACQGISSALIFSTGTAIVASVFPPNRRGRALGLTATCAFAGLSLGPVLGGFINHQFGWRSIFYLTALAGTVATLLAAWRLKAEWADAQGQRFDLVGSACYILALAATLYGLSSLSQTAWGKYVLGAGLALMVLFLVHEARQEHPILHVGLFRHNSAFTFANIAAMSNYSATFAISFLVSLDLQVVRGYDSRIAGLILLSQPLIMALLSPFTGTLSDRVEPRLVASWGMGLTAIGLFLFIFTTAATPLWATVANLTLVGVGLALFAVHNNSAIMGSVEREQYGVASSMLGTMRLVGGALSMAIVTLILSFHGRDAGPAHGGTTHLLASSRTAYIVFTIVCIAGTLASLTGKSSRVDDVKYAKEST